MAERTEQDEDARLNDPYAILGVGRDATDAEIRYAYRQALRRPIEAEDGATAADPERLRWAYGVLSDPRKRQAYDQPASEELDAEPPPRSMPPVLRDAEEPASRNPITRLTGRLPRPWRIALDWVLTIAGAVLIVLAIKAWVVNPYRIPSSSMEPTLHCARTTDATAPDNGCEARFSDRVLANRFIYHLRDPNRSEIVVFNTPPKAAQECGAGGTFVKRLIGLPGETVKEKTGRFYIDGKKLDDSGYIKPGRRDDRSGKWNVGPNHFFFVGDNRTQSCDSRRWGSVPRGNLIGPVFATYWPPNRIHVATPGPIGAAILAGLGLVAAAFVALGVRRRRVR